MNRKMMHDGFYTFCLPGNTLANPVREAKAKDIAGQYLKVGNEEANKLLQEAKIQGQSFFVTCIFESHSYPIFSVRFLFCPLFSYLPSHIIHIKLFYLLNQIIKGCPR
uniref:Uncharacterized protein n=1 Tax=Candidatus Kentrum eta TaxID=2126337 RepID=A0A450V2B5_9GAMM|nr:MAG: hypothetical protein BECKH772A_GA0070896_101495 [Candidatus Kentron sp. H]VFJ99150.1 MAG: hypothetical protein BECKH772B_GA0070898_101515 [Candidatus Kentron sp. H]